MSVSEKRIRVLYSKPRRVLVQAVLEHAKRNGQQYVYGGPANWSRDELINHIVREMGGDLK